MAPIGRVDVDDDTPLLWVLRDVLGMTGTKFGCGMALCGACTVHVDGVADALLHHPVDSVGTSEITTIEAIGATPAGARSRRPGSTARSSQCGYCQSGQIMSAAALLAEQSAPDATPTSTTPCPATSAAAAPMSASATRSKRAAQSNVREADHDPDRIAFRRRRRPAQRRRRSLPARLPEVRAAAGGGLLLSLSLPFAGGEAEAADADGFAPNAFVRIDRDGQIVLTMPQVEMGQGTYTSMPMLIAEELEVDLDQVRLEHAPPNDKLYANPLLGVQATGSSTSIRGVWKPLRQAGATARTMLVAAAAKRWNVDPASCRAQERRRASRRRRAEPRYGELAADAAQLPVPEKRRLKEPEDFS